MNLVAAGTVEADADHGLDDLDTSDDIIDRHAGDVGRTRKWLSGRYMDTLRS